MVSQGSSPNWIARSTFQSVVVNGEVVVSNLKFSAECRG